MRKTLWFALLLCLVPVVVHAATLFVLRHAEDHEGSPDPLLTEEGLARSRRLADLLEFAGVQFVLSSDYHRTRDTVAPLAERLRLEVEIYDPRDLPGLVQRLEELDGRAVVVGHSNTTPALVGLLGGEPGPPIDDATEFDRLYILRTASAGETETIRLRY